MNRRPATRRHELRHTADKMRMRATPTYFLSNMTLGGLGRMPDPATPLTSLNFSGKNSTGKIKSSENAARGYVENPGKAIASDGRLWVVACFLARFLLRPRC